MIKTRTLLIFVFLLCGLNSVRSQVSYYPVLAMEVQSDPVDSTVNSLGDVVDPDSLNYSANMIIALYDTLDINHLEIKLGSTNGSANYLQKTFAFDVTGVNADGTSYTRDGSVITLNLGRHKGMAIFYSELVIKRNDGSYTSPVYFSR